MRIYNKRGFISGLITMMLCIVGMVSIFIKGFSAGLAVLLVILFVFSIVELGKSMSRMASVNDIMAENDERNQYILLKTSHKSIQILETIGFITTILLMLLYVVTRDRAILGAFILSCVYITICFVVVVAANIYYEKHE